MENCAFKKLENWSSKFDYVVDSHSGYVDTFEKANEVIREFEISTQQRTLPGFRRKILEVSFTIIHFTMLKVKIYLQKLLDIKYYGRTHKDYQQELFLLLMEFLSKYLDERFLTVNMAQTKQ